MDSYYSAPMNKPQDYDYPNAAATYEMKNHQRIFSYNNHTEGEPDIQNQIGMINDDNYDSGEEQQIKNIREQIKKKYHKNSPLNQPRDIHISQTEIPDQNNMPLEDSLNAPYQERSFDMQNKLDKMRKERGFPNPGYSTIENSKYDYPVTSVSCTPDIEIDRLKQDHASLKTDNIIFKEDIYRLTEINKLLDYELSVQRARNIEIAGENDRLIQEKLLLESENSKLKNEIARAKVTDKRLAECYNEKMEIEDRLNNAEDELMNIKNIKDNFEIEYKVLKEKHDDLVKKHDDLTNAFNNMKNSHDDEIDKIEEKLNLMAKEIENLQRENFELRTSTEKYKKDWSTSETLREEFKDKYMEEKNKNILLSQKLKEIEEDFKSLLQDKETENLLKKREEELKRLKLQSKNKLMNDLKNKIANFRNDRLKKKNEENTKSSSFGDD